MTRTPTPSRHTLREDVRAMLLLAAVVALVFWPWLFAGKSFYWGDIGLYFLPLARFLGKDLQQGTIPLWNPYLFCGTPFVGNPQASPFYPAAALLVLFPAPVYLMLDNVLHLWLAGAGLYLLLRRGRLNLDFYPAVMGAMAFMLGGFIVSKTQFPNMVQALAWVPLLLLCTERLVERATAAHAVALGCALGLQILAAHAQISVLTIYLLAIYVVACLRWEHDRMRQHLLILLRLVPLVCMVALGLSCVFWLPVVELTQVAARQRLGIIEAHRFYLLPQELTNLFWPMRFGSPLSGNWNAPGNFWEKACYMGIEPCLLAMLGIRWAFAKNVAEQASEQQRQARFWLFIFIVSVLLSIGWRGGLFLLAYYVAPGIKLFHDPARMLMGASLAIPILAAEGLQQVLYSPAFARARAFSPVMLLLIVLDLGRFVHAIYPLQSVSNIEAMQSNRILQLLRADEDVAWGRARIFFADPNKNRHQLLKYQTYYADDPQFLAKWSETLMPNLGMLFDLPQAGGYEPVAERVGKQRATQADQQLPGELRAMPQSSSYADMLAAMSVKYLIVYRAQPLPRTVGLDLVARGNEQHQGYRAWIYRNQKFQPRARWDESSAAVTTEEPYSPDVVSFAFAGASRDRTFMLTDSAYGGWRAYLDGQRVAITPTKDGFRRVSIPASLAGKSQQLTIVYQPASFSLSLFITFGTLMCLSGVCSYRLAQRVTRRGVT